VIGIISRGGWGRGPHNRRWCNFYIGGILLVHLLFFFIGVAEDNDLFIVGWPNDVVVEVTEESFDEFLIL
jgi:hypothetical protein